MPAGEVWRAQLHPTTGARPRRGNFMAAITERRQRKGLPMCGREPFEESRPKQKKKVVVPKHHKSIRSTQTIGCPNDTAVDEVAIYWRLVRNLKVMRTAPVRSRRRKPSGSSSGWRGATSSTATASERSNSAEVSLSSGTPCLSAIGGESSEKSGRQTAAAPLFATGGCQRPMTRIRPSSPPPSKP